MSVIDSLVNTGKIYEVVNVFTPRMMIVERLSDRLQFLLQVFDTADDIEAVEHALHLTRNVIGVAHLVHVIYEYADGGMEPTHSCVILTTPQDVNRIYPIVNRNTPAFVLRFIFLQMVDSLRQLERLGITDMPMSFSNVFITVANEVIMTGNTEAVFGNDPGVLCRRFSNFVSAMISKCGITHPEILYLYNTSRRAESMSEVMELLRAPPN